MPAVGDAGEIVHQRELGHFRAQAVDRHQQEAEIHRHRQEHQHQRQEGLHLVVLGEGKAASGAAKSRHQAKRIDDDDQDDDDARQLRAAIVPSVGRRQQHLQRQHQRQRLRHGEDREPGRRAVIDVDEEADADEGVDRNQRRAVPVDLLLVEALDAHGGKTGGQHHEGAGGQQRQQRSVKEIAQRRHGSRSGAHERRAGPVSRRFERGIGALHIGPDQAQRQEVDDHCGPQRRNAQHRENRDGNCPVSPGSIESPRWASAPTVPVVLADKVQRARLTESDRCRTIPAVVLI